MFAGQRVLPAVIICLPFHLVVHRLESACDSDLERARKWTEHENKGAILVLPQNTQHLATMLPVPCERLERKTFPSSPIIIITRSETWAYDGMGL